MKRKAGGRMTKNWGLVEGLKVIDTVFTLKPNQIVYGWMTEMFKAASDSQASKTQSSLYE